MSEVGFEELMLTKRMDMKNMRKLVEKSAKGIKEVKTSQDEMKTSQAEMKIRQDEMKIRQDEMKTSQVEMKIRQDEMKTGLSDEIKSVYDKLSQGMKGGQNKLPET